MYVSSHQKFVNISLYNEPIQYKNDIVIKHNDINNANIRNMLY